MSDQRDQKVRLCPSQLKSENVTTLSGGALGFPVLVGRVQGATLQESTALSADMMSVVSVSQATD